PPPAEEAGALADRCRELWRQRERIADALGRSGPEPDEQVRADLLDLAVLWADLRATGAAPAAHAEALEVLDQAEALLGPSCVLDRERRVHALAAGRAGPAEAVDPKGVPQTAWEHYALGRAELRAGDLDRAAGHLERAVCLQPGALWPSFHLGLCAY